jgi:calcineurin-like phosphoesterase family protein
MNTFFTSDVHFLHANIIKYSARPFVKTCDKHDLFYWETTDAQKLCQECKKLSVEYQTQELIKRWNAKVGPNDLVYNFGDFIWTNDSNEWLEIFEQLNGKQRILVGNHDKCIADKHGIAKTVETLDSNMCKLLNGKLEFIQNYHEERFKNQWIVMFHFPIGSWHRQMYGAICTHGHTHGTYPYSWPRSAQHGRIMDVGADCHDWAPVSLDEIHDIMKTCTDEKVHKFEN